MTEPAGFAPVVLATELGAAGGGLALAAAVAVAAARGQEAGEPAPVLLVELDAPVPRGPTMLASRAARRLELRLREEGFERAAARGAICWLGLPAGEEGVDALQRVAASVPDAALIVAFAGAADCRSALARLEARGAVIRCELPQDRSLAALVVRELRDRGQMARVERRSIGPLGSRRALAGIEPGGPASRRAARLAAAFASPHPERPQPRAAEAGQALPLVLGLTVALVLAAVVLVAIGGAVAGAERGQRAADLAAISAVRSMRDDVPRLVSPPRLPNGAANPTHLDRDAYLGRAVGAAREAARRNGLVPTRVRISFPDASSPVPLRARVDVTASLDPAGAIGSRPGKARHPSGRIRLVLHAEAEAVPPAGLAVAQSGAAGPPQASGGGYSGPLAYRQGRPMRPDVARAYDELSAAAGRAGFKLLITSAFRSDAEQARLFAANPDPRWVAPPGTSLHRCATELDLGPAAAYGWLAANAGRFGFLRRYPWEPWHFGYTGGPAPCSAAGNASATPDGEASGRDVGLPAFVPAAYRAPILSAAARWNVSAGLLAAQLEAESGFDPRAVSPAGALGIAQFIPSTAAAYGLRDPFDAHAAIDAEARLMSELVSRFGSISLALAAYNAGAGAVEACGCIPPYPETQAYVARILGLMDASGQAALPPLEVRLID
jgi:hypothetical protein